MCRDCRKQFAHLCALTSERIVWSTLSCNESSDSAEAHRSWSQGMLQFMTDDAFHFSLFYFCSRAFRCIFFLCKLLLYVYISVGFQLIISIYIFIYMLWMRWWPDTSTLFAERLPNCTKRVTFRNEIWERYHHWLPLHVHWMPCFSLQKSHSRPLPSCDYID